MFTKFKNNQLRIREDICFLYKSLQEKVVSENFVFMQKLARQYLRTYISFTIKIHWGDL